jgi:signal transduction histidine kinase
LAKQREVRVETHLSPSLPTINFDAAAIERSLLNLISNAVQASPAGKINDIGKKVPDHFEVSFNTNPGHRGLLS